MGVMKGDTRSLDAPKSCFEDSFYGGLMAACEESVGETLKPIGFRV